MLPGRGAGEPPRSVKCTHLSLIRGPGPGSPLSQGLRRPGRRPTRSRGLGASVTPNREPRSGLGERSVGWVGGRSPKGRRWADGFPWKWL